MVSVQAYMADDHYKSVISNGRHELIADEPLKVGGEDLGFAPEELLCSALAACTNATLRMYADRKGWPLTGVRTKVDFERDTERNISRLTREVELFGDLNVEQRQRLLAIANACPMHKTLSNPISIETSLKRDDPNH